MSTLKWRLTFLALAVGGALLLLPATGQAAQVFGSRLLGTATEGTPNQGCKGTVDVPCTLVSLIAPSDPAGAEADTGAPSDGVITKFRIKAIASAPSKVTFHVADINLIMPGVATATTSGAGLTVTVAQTPEDEAPIQEFSGSVPVKKGQHLAVDATTDVLLVNAANGDEFTYVFAPPLVAGRGPQESQAAINELFLQATLEPDADGDGFGDETQDKCPSQATTQGACDNTPPAVTGFAVNGGAISYNLSEAASVSFKLEKKTIGRKVRGKCVVKTRKNSAKKHCARFRAIGRGFDGTGKKGANQVALPNFRKLKPGVYRLTMTARDAAGNQTVKTASFKVKAKKKKKR